MDVLLLSGSCFSEINPDCVQWFSTVEWNNGLHNANISDVNTSSIFFKTTKRNGFEEAYKQIA